MIRLENLSIKFNRIIIDNVNLNIYPNEITLFVGESGSGKSSLLNVLGLLDTQNECQYYFYDQLIDVEDYGQMKRKYISYVFQDSNVFDDYNILDNFKAMYNICGRKYSEEEVYGLLKDVSLDYVNLKLKAKSLSGGEKQRLAIGLALVKQPELLLLDEPTASLDKDNSEGIVNILHKLKDKGLMIVVSTHNPIIYNADHIYGINNKKLIEKYDGSTRTRNSFKKDILKFYWLKYVLLNITNHFVLALAILFVFVFGIYHILHMSVFLENTNKTLNDQLNLIADNVIMVNNTESILSEESAPYFNNYYFPIEHSEVQYIKELECVKDVYPYYAISRNYANAYYDGEELKSFDYSSPDIIRSESNIINMNEELFSTITITSCMNEYQDVKCIMLDESVEKGVYISTQLADVLGIESLNRTKITFDFPIIMGHSASNGSVIYEDGSESASVPTRPLQILLKEMTFEIRGIYPTTSTQDLFFDVEGGEKIYIDYRYMEAIHEDVVDDSQLYDEYINFLKKYNGENEFYCSTNSSCFIVVAASYENVKTIADMIKDYNNDFYVKTKNSYGLLLEDMTIKNNSIMVVQPLIIYAVVIMLVAFIYIYILRQRRKVLSFIFANGIDFSYKLPLYEMLVLLIVSMPINYILVSLFIGIKYYSLFVGVIHMIVVILIASICFVINKIYFKKFNPIQYLKSQR